MRLLGRGGMGAVFLAWDRLLCRHVAIKILAPEFADDAVARERFVREAALAGRLGAHPHIVTAHEAGEWEQRPTWPSSTCRTAASPSNSGTRARRHGSKAMRWLAQAAAAVDHAHGAKVVHRDIKPAEPAPRRRRESQRRRLRCLPARRRNHAHCARRRRGHSGLSRAGAGRRPRRDRSQRPVRLGRRRLPTPDGQAAPAGTAVSWRLRRSGVRPCARRTSRSVAIRRRPRSSMRFEQRSAADPSRPCPRRHGGDSFHRGRHPALAARPRAHRPRGTGSAAGSGASASRSSPRLPSLRRLPPEESCSAEGSPEHSRRGRSLASW